MGKYLIIAVRKPLSSRDLQQISHIAYEESFFNPRVIISVEEVIKRISQDKSAFYVRDLRGTSYVTVERPANGKPFLKTTGNRTQADLLLSLRAC